MSINLNGNTFTTWDDVEQELFTPEEIAESKLRVELIGELVTTQKKKISEEKKSSVDYLSLYEP